jgi:hypothetical protein
MKITLSVEADARPTIAFAMLFIGTTLPPLITHNGTTNVTLGAAIGIAVAKVLAAHRPHS